jgi:sarcosine oxidase subunit alpha
VFRCNDLPGIMLASAAQRLMRRYAVLPAQRVVVLAANADAYRALEGFAAAGIAVTAVIDLRDKVPGEQYALLAAQGIPLYSGHCIVEALPDADGTRVAKVRVARLGEAETVAELACDGVFMSVGWAPAAALLYQAGTKMRYDEAVHQFVPDKLPDGVFACGRVNGIHTLESRLLDGERAGSDDDRTRTHLGDAAALDQRHPMVGVVAGGIGVGEDANARMGDDFFDQFRGTVGAAAEPGVFVDQRHLRALFRRRQRRTQS